MSKKLLLPVLLAALLAGCTSTPKNEDTGAPVETLKPTSSTRPTDVVRVEAGNLGNKLPDELTNPNSILSKRSIYFDLDKYDVKDEFRNLLAAHAKFLNNNRQFKILIQGNTDERGSREYNLSLGQKRAEAVKKSLALLGVREDQLESVSLGKEKQVCGESSEECWSKNRRADILYSGEF
ncbi:MAG: peptidoglycan-associated lipoprotein Pal [Pseudomonadota bacterium]|jgi:peptidoglycan-associated lipoprotein